MALAACMIALLLCAVNIEILHDQELLIREAHVITQDGVKRPEHNPRLSLLAASIPRGNIYDRNGILLATSSWDELEKAALTDMRSWASLSMLLVHIRKAGITPSVRSQQRSSAIFAPARNFMPPTHP